MQSLSLCVEMTRVRHSPGRCSFLTEDLSCVRRAFTDSRLPSEIQRAAREEILNLRLDLDQSLFVGEIDQDPEHLAILLDTVGVRIASEDLLRHCQVFLAEEQP